MPRKIRILRRGTVLPNKTTYDEVGQEITLTDADFLRITPESFQQGYVQDLGAVEGSGMGAEVSTVAAMVIDQLQPTVRDAQANVARASEQASGAARMADDATAAAAQANDRASAAMGSSNRHRNDTTNPHHVTAEQLGLDEVDNTPDAEKPVSGPQQAALDQLKALVDQKATAGQLQQAVAALVGSWAPSTEPARAQAAEQALDGRITALANTVAGQASQLAALGLRTTRVVTARVAVPALAVNVPKDIPVTWAVPAASVPTAVFVLLEPTGSLLGSISVAVKPGTASTTGCTVTATSPIILALGNGYVNVIGILTA